MRKETFTKSGSAPGAAAAEAAGLRWLREGSNRVIEVLDVDEASNSLTIPRIRRSRPTAESARTAGSELARIHAQGADAFGAPPAGWGGPTFIGRIQQECTPTDRWARFYTRQRVLPFAEAAHAGGTLADEGLDTVRRACEAIERTDEDSTVARIHGDLWNGNVMFSADGPWFIDPAAHGGHALTDIAMLALFGAPFFDDIVAGYQSVAPLDSHWREQLPMHQLHPLAVHTQTHGKAYALDLIHAAEATLDLLGD
ncbi:fructosamine kinase family protein [Corynebacterium cystitidis]|uniref:fructosamine kinase family protein n=1 Tax=Corynebacterium cystitidis TaxID=35757 RepID=UPI00211F3E9C|nr:fructosamine kinase family protein [Corynebacterium cystitidis]